MAITMQARNAFGAGCTARRSATVRCAAAPQDKVSAVPRLQSAALGLAAVAALALSAGPSSAEPRLPPLDTDPLRCERAYVGNTIGQANAVSNKILDLRQCDFRGKNLSAKTLSGGLLSDSDLTGANLQEVVMSKAYAVNAIFKGADLTNSVIDRADLDGCDLSEAKFVNAVITGTTFKGANLAGANFEDALIGSEDAKRLCSNPTLTGESRDQVGCRSK